MSNGMNGSMYTGGDSVRKVIEQDCRQVALPWWRAEQLDSMRGSRRGLCTCDSLSAAPFAGTGAETRSTFVNTGAMTRIPPQACARREPSQSRSEARCVRLARSSCAVASSRQGARQTLAAHVISFLSYRLSATMLALVTDIPKTSIRLPNFP